MSYAYAQGLSVGKTDKSALYVQCRNGAVYRYNRQLTPAGIDELSESIRAARWRVQLTGWTSVRPATKK